MEIETILEEQIHKKGRHRKKQLYNSLMSQMEFYFSDSNLSKDKFLLPLIQNSPDVDISVFLNFNKIRKLTTNIDDIVKAINNSELLELSDDKTKVRRKTPINVKENVDNCTLYVERIKADATHECLVSIFSVFGNVTYVSIPKYKHNKANKGFAFVEFETEQEATDALSYFESIGCRMSSLMAPEALCSITTYEGKMHKPSDTKDDYDKEEDEGNMDKHPDIKNDDDKQEDESDRHKPPDIENDDKKKYEGNTQKKRKHSIEEDDECNKRVKTDDTTDHIENSAGDQVENATENIQNDDYEGKKKKKHKKMKRKLFRELGLQVLSRMEWKKIRNRYLDNQKAKMKQLKQFLYKNRFNNQVDMKQKTEHIVNCKPQTEKIDVGKEKPVEDLAYVPGVIVKIELLEYHDDAKKVKEDLKQFSTEIKYVDVPMHGGEGYLRFSDANAAQLFCTSEYKGQAIILEGKEEEEYWNKINDNRCNKFKKNQKRLRGREKLLKRAEKELGKHIKFDDAD